MHILVKAFLAVTAVSIVMSSSAGTKTWTGGGDGTSWSDAANWDAEGAPVSGAGDDVVINFSAATANLTMDTGDAISIGTLKITPTVNAKLTLSGGAITLTHQADITSKKDFTLFVGSVSGGAGNDIGVKVLINNDIVLPEVGGYSFSRDYNWTGYNGAELAGVISGAGTVNFFSGTSGQGQNYMVLFGHNTYTGGTYLKKNRVRCNTLDAFGSSTQAVRFDDGIIWVNVAGTFPYAFDLGEPTVEKQLHLNAAIDWTGGLVDSQGVFDTSVANGKPFYIFTAKQGASATCSGAINLPLGSVRPNAGYRTMLTFSGAIACREVTGHDNDNVSTGNYTFQPGDHSVGEFQVGVGTYYWEADDAFKGADLMFMGQWAGAGCILQLKGHPQTFKNLSSAINGSAFNGHAIQSTSATRVTVKPTDDCLAACQLTDNLTFAMDAATSDVTLTLTNRVHAMKGNLIVSNGTLRVNGETTFKNVKTLEIAGGTLDLESSTAAAFSGVTAIILGANAKLKVGVTQPFASSGVTIRMADDTGRLEIGAGVDMAIDAIYIGEEPIDGGTYSGDPAKGTVIDQITGAGTVTLPEVEVPTKPASWAGNGDDANITSLANWSTGTTAADLSSKGLVATFAEKGSEAVFNQAAKFKGVVFDIPGGQPTNTFALTGLGPLALYELGVAVSDPETDEQYRYTVDVPLQIKKTQTWNFSASSLAAVSVAQPISGLYKITKSGQGALELHAESPNYDADVDLLGGITRVYVEKDAFGKPSSGSRILLDGNGGGAQLFLYDTTIAKPITWNQSSNLQASSPDQCDIFAATGTNVFAQTVTLTVQNNNNPRIWVADGAVLRTEGKLMESFDENKYWTVAKYGFGTLEIAAQSHAAIYAMYGGTLRLKTALSARGGSNPCGSAYLFYSGSSLVVMEGEKYMNTGWNSIQFYGDGTFDLNGFDQVCGIIVAGSDSVRGKIYSEKPATLTTFLYSDTNWRKTDIAGAVSIVLDSYDVNNTATVDGTITTTGSLTVTKGKLVMTANASWLNPTNGAVSVTGTGKLTINQSKTFSKKMNFVLADSGKVELAAGVSQRCADLYLDGSDQPAELGTWGATGSGAQHINDTHFAGTGVLTVRGSKPWGLMMIVR